jgi:hypothetical protein
VTVCDFSAPYDADVQYHFRSLPLYSCIRPNIEYAEFVPSAKKYIFWTHES